VHRPRRASRSELQSNGLTGTLPAELSALLHLFHLCVGAVLPC
jgi:hypothetical protein